MRSGARIAALLVAFFCACGIAEEPADAGPPHVVRNPKVDQARRLLGRAMAMRDESRRSAALREAELFVDQQVGEQTEEAGLRVDLLGVRARIESYKGDLNGARQSVKAQQAAYATSHSSEAVQAWVDQQVETLRNLGEFDLAIAHLSEWLADRAGSAGAAERALLIGDIAVQKAYPEGPYESAIRQYADVAERYRSVAPDIADAAKLREAKTLWRAGKIESAKDIFAVLAKSGNEVIAEEAKHYPELMEQHPRPRDPDANE